MLAANHDSSRARIAPVCDALQSRRNHWVRALLLLNHGGNQAAVDLEGLDLKFDKGYWGRTERSFDPPVALLSWLIRYPPPQLLAPPVVPERTLLADGEPAVVARALHALRTSAAPKGWHLLEGPAVPDVMIEPPDALRASPDVASHRRGVGDSRSAASVRILHRPRPGAGRRSAPRRGSRVRGGAQPAGARGELSASFDPGTGCDYHVLSGGHFVEPRVQGVQHFFNVAAADDPRLACLSLSNWPVDSNWRAVRIVDESIDRRRTPTAAHTPS